ncbi:hypothetical protein FPV58_12985 [Mycolicibacterium porcinum]|uniref:hypothetical protein n=1 Tax=Mycolicibacterium porcinum TaxID=39693 RepID=UPI0011904E4D|nr:hypothetical protein [Mycolicibacterium porcinum]TVY01526.1 hypothetical protein FPV58_12985 [Mycolicibacterium porcinum]
MFADRFANLKVSEGFANLFGDIDISGRGGLVYVLRDVDPGHVLVQVTAGRGKDGRAEDEYVLDPVYLADAPIELFEDRGDKAESS